MNQFKIRSKYKPTKDQRNAINKLTKALNSNNNFNVLLGVTGSGKTFTIANVIEKLQRPSIIVSHNKTLAAQLYQEFRDYFPENAVSYFVSYYDYYQPEAYIPSTDTYIEKDSSINEYIDKLRLETTKNIISRNDVIVVASVSSIYNIGNPQNYINFSQSIKSGDIFNFRQFIDRLIKLQYERNDFDFKRGTFRIRDSHIDIMPSYQDSAIRVDYNDKFVINVFESDPLTGKIINKCDNNYVLFPAKHYITDNNNSSEIFKEIRSDAEKQEKYFLNKKMYIEAQRIKQKVQYDLEMINELGYVKGIENYSRYFDGRKKGDTPYSLLHFFKYKFKNNWLFTADESHITFPQIRGMYAGDQSRKKTLIEYGFRLPSALDNRPLKFDEFLNTIPNFIAVSATPDDWELNKSKTDGGEIVEQLVRPTGIPDPLVEIVPIKNQIRHISKVLLKLPKGQRALITTLTKQMAEDLCEYLKEQKINAQYLHSDIKTLERSDILDNLRNGKYDCLVGVNLLREGLDLPEVSLVAILDADKEGFLRSKTSLIQTMGRAARHAQGKVVLYADKITPSIKFALSEINRRRIYQLNYNKIYKITPKTIKKPIREKLIEIKDVDNSKQNEKIDQKHIDSLIPEEKNKLIISLRKEMKNSADNMEFEKAAYYRDKLSSIEKSLK